LIQLREVTKTYPVGGGLTVLQSVDLRVLAGEYVGILGPSGSGKSTLLHIVGLLDRPTTGQVRFQGTDTTTMTEDQLSRLRGRCIGFVFQSFHLVPQLSVIENVELPLFYQRVPIRERRRRAKACLADVHLEDRAAHLPSQLSGGECQRVAIARALIADPALILADEPTGNLDSRTGEDIIRILEGLHARGRTVLVITHDPSIAEHVPRVIGIADGRITADDRRPAAVSDPPAEQGGGP